MSLKGASRAPLVVLSPQYQGRDGGIQHYCRALIAALEQADSKGDCPALVIWQYDSGGHLTKFERLWRQMVFSAKVLFPFVKQRPQAVLVAHAHFLFLGYLLYRLTGIKYAVVIYGIEIWGELGFFQKRALASADRIIAISRYTRDRLLEKNGGIDPKKVSIVSCTFEEDKFSPGAKPSYLLSRHQLTHQHRILLTVGRLAEQEMYKGYDQVLRALPSLIPDFPDVRYFIVGGGGDISRVRKLISTLGLEKNVVLTGRVPTEELVDYYRLADLFIMPSKGEGFGIVYLEALACGKPVIAGNQDGSRDPLLDGRLGYLIDPDDLLAIANSIRDVLNRGCAFPQNMSAVQARDCLVEEFGAARFRTRIQHEIAMLLRVDPTESNIAPKTLLN